MYFLLYAFKEFTLYRALLTVGLLYACIVTVQAAHVDDSKILEAVNLQLKWVHQFQFAGYYAAKQQGYYAEEGLNVDIHEFNLEKPVVKQVVSGVADYGISDIGLLFNYAKGDPVKVLAAIFQHNPLVYISKRSSGIFSPFEMSGKRIMQRSSATDDAPLRALLVDAGIGKDQYSAVKYDFSFDTFISGKADVMSGYMTSQPFDLRQKGLQINIINPQNYGIDFYGDLLFTSEQELKNHPGRADRFLKATLKGWRYAFDHVEEVIQLIKNQYHSRSSLEQLRNEATEMRKLVLPDTIPLGHIKINRLRRIVDTYQQLNLSRTLDDNELKGFIYDKNNKVNLTKQERSWLRQYPVIRLGIDRNFAPYE
ncbi:MAG: ABC transporter substrate-binding protein [Methylococcaceae bacterium]